MLGNHFATPDSISVSDLLRLIGSDKAPLILDVRREKVFIEANEVLPAARHADHRAPQAAIDGKAVNGIVCYCVHGHNVGQGAAARLRADGHNAMWLEGGIEAWKAAGGPVVARAPDAAARFGEGSLWVTRRRPKIDRVACPWLIRRFIDARARFYFVEPAYVLSVAEDVGGMAYDVEGAPVTHDGERCSFDTLLDRYAINDAHLRRLADIVRGADTGRPELAPEAAGLLSISLGLSALESDDRVMVERGFHLYDGLYAFLRFAGKETHNWPPKA